MRDASTRLLMFPYSGTRDKEHPGHYVLHIWGCRLIYTIAPDTGDSETAGDIRIVAAFGPGQEQP